MALLTTQNLAAGLFGAGVLAVLAFTARHYWTEYKYKHAMQRWREASNEMRKNDLHYEYKPLDHPRTKTIRLLELFPAEDLEVPIRIALRSVSLLDPNRPAYEALSYCWGDLDDPCAVLCRLEPEAMPVSSESEENDGLIWITQNLWAALRRLRLSNRTRLIWADAVCINQSDDEEKSWQVRMMGDVYRNADSVLIWLGVTENENIATLEHFIPQILEAKARKHAAHDLRSYWQLGHADRKAFKIPSPVSQALKYEAFNEITRNPYLRRIWIVQEFALAKEAIMVCDFWTMPWEPFNEAFNFLEVELDLTNPSSTHDAYKYINALSSTAEQISLRAPSLLHLLSTHSQSLASDPRDKIFALAGLAEDAGDIEINYSKPVDQIYHDTALRLIVTSQSLDVLTVAACNPQTESLPLPSWVPDWRASGIAKDLFDPSVNFGFHATGESRYDLVTSKDGLRLQVLGYELDTIVAIGPSIASRFDIYTFWKLWDYVGNDAAWAEWAHMCHDYIAVNAEQQRYGPTGETPLQVFRQTVLVGDPMDQLQASPEDEVIRFEVGIMVVRALHKLPAWCNKFLVKIAASIYVLVFLFLFILQVAIGYGVPRHYRDAVFMSTIGRKMVVTAQGFIGLSTAQNVAVGDGVFLLKGGKIPYILQRIPGNKEVFVLAGDAYVHGHMHGREWSPSQCRPIWLV